MASGKEIRINIVSALNAAGIEATKQQVSQMSKSVSKSMADMTKDNKRHWADIKAAWDMGCSAISKAWQGITAGLKSAFKFETQTAQFKTLIGSMDEAKKHMADLKELGDTPPFSLDEFAKASRELMVMSNGTLGYKNSLKLIGDAAAATGRPIEEMGHAVGRLYGFIRDGQPLNRATMELRNMGVITPEVAQKLEDMQKAGKTNAEIWAEVEGALGKYNGAMEETEKTGNGLLGAIQSRWDNIVRAFGTAWQDTAKEGMSEVLEKMKSIEEDGTLELWASKIAQAIREAKEAFDALYASMHRVGTAAATDKFDKSRGEGGNLLTFFGNAWAELGGIGAGIHGSLTGEGYSNAYDAYVALNGYGATADEYARKLNARKRASGEWSEDIDIRDAQAKVDAEIKAEAAAKKKEEAEHRAVEQTKRDADEKTRIAKQLADGQVKIAEKAAKEAAEKQEKEDAKLAKKRLRNAIEAQRAIADATKRYNDDAAAKVEAAQSKLQQAWGWYRDKGSLASQIQEEKAEAAAERQYGKDFQNLRRKHSNWRTATNLTLDEEATRRVALAKEERDAAAKWEQETAEATARSAELLGELTSIFKEA